MTGLPELPPLVSPSARKLTLRAAAPGACAARSTASGTLISPMS